MENSQTLKLSKNKLAETFAKRGLKSDYRYLVGDIFDTYYPSANIQRRFIEIAQNTNQPNPFQQARPVIDRMYKRFKRLKLNEEWNFKLEDFLPQSVTSPEKSALPQQPMPAPNIVGQAPQMNTAMGLTPTENALLSREEQQIRLRQRGLV